MSRTDDGGPESIEPEAEGGETNWYSEETATFGDRLAGAREAAEMSQSALAQRIGVKTGTLRKWEDDLAEPRANRLNMLAGLLGVSLTWLLSGQGEGPEAPGDTIEIPPDVSSLLDELRTLRSQMEAQSAKLATIEKRLRRALSDPL